ncbi:hypothetical protein BJ085DRAFT_31361 [Dimargaris cristalligena]|uniref:Uncharacterized protein n=1 Tax=Dimargaris cristalligena TaxID=215637 RepID=A0A4P9ZTX2_9FUNG|nr:hypothetical protein BJ085DRAFT_31361 [Dimargaris cristalligena]|eukprot:RKP36983.1 hypothetical protein BJ085DRAFT_31361 [Dimargaris cristalligena]
MKFLVTTPLVLASLLAAACAGPNGNYYGDLTTNSGSHILATDNLNAFMGYNGQTNRSRSPQHSHTMDNLTDYLNGSTGYFSQNKQCEFPQCSSSMSSLSRNTGGCTFDSSEYESGTFGQLHTGGLDDSGYSQCSNSLNTNSC